MRALVVYESHWGNTAAIAHAIAEGIGAGARVMSTAEAKADSFDGLDLLVVGAPVIGFRLPTQQAVDNMRTNPGRGAPPDVSHPPVRSWLESLPSGTGAAVAAAAFDTQVRGPFGSAAPAILESLTAAGYRPLSKPTGFTVKGSRGPLRDGELERARLWGAELAALIGLPS
jgi:Flavodoxin